MLDQCSEKCGWIAGIIAALSFGTFGVPIKATKARIKVDPLVMQSYKSLMCFITCWLVIPLGEPFKFTPWGIGKILVLILHIQTNHFWNKKYFFEDFVLSR